MMTGAVALRFGRRFRLGEVAMLAALMGCTAPSIPFLPAAYDPRFSVLPYFTQIEVPASPAPTSLVLEVLARNAADEPISAGTVTWSASEPGVTFTTSGDRTIVDLPASLGAGATVNVSATNGVRSGTALIMLVRSNATPTDEAAAGRMQGEPPSVVLHTGSDGSACASDMIDAFVGRGMIGTWTTSAGGCVRSDALIFSTTARPFLYRPAEWTANKDVVDGMSAGARIEVPIQLVIGVPLADVDSARRSENNLLVSTEGTFREARTGIAFPATQQTTIVQELPATFKDCVDVPSLPSSVAPLADRINIYHIRSIDENGPGGTRRGQYCPPNVILIDHVYALATSLQHELGHALGLIAQNTGHVKDVQGLKWDNLMWDNISSGQDFRYRLSLGQLYRMHVDGRSWILRPKPGLGDGPFVCPCNPYSRDSCPALPADLRPLNITLPGSWTGTCS